MIGSILVAVLFAACAAHLPAGATIAAKSDRAWLVDVHLYQDCETVRLVYYDELPERWSGHAANLRF